MKAKNILVACVLATTLGAAVVPAQAAPMDHRMHRMMMHHRMHRMVRHMRMRHAMHRMVRHDMMRHRMMRHGM